MSNLTMWIDINQIIGFFTPIINNEFGLTYLKYVPLQCVFHSIRFKVNKGWVTAVTLFLCLKAT